jgi:hypothetical protein
MTWEIANSDGTSIGPCETQPIPTAIEMNDTDPYFWVSGYEIEGATGKKFSRDSTLRLLLILNLLIYYFNYIDLKL